MRRLGIVIADVSGKGISAAILMAFVRPVIRAALDRTGDPAMALERTNRILVEERPTGLLVTVLCGILELESGAFRFANAGHEPPLIVRSGGAGQRSAGDSVMPTAAWATTAGPLLGAFRTLGLAESAVTLDAGDALVLYTDGVTDATAEDGERFGEERLATLVSERCLDSAAEAVETVMGAVGAWEGPEPADDLALLVIRRAPDRAGSSSPT